MSAILNRFRLSQGWTPEDGEDHRLRVASWLEVLGVAGVPVDQYDDLYRRAVDTRMRRQAAGLEVWYIKPDDLVIEYRALQDDEKSRTAITPESCPARHDHLSETEALQDYGFPGEAEEWLPCHVCRPEAFRRRKVEAAEKRAEINRAEKMRLKIVEMTGGAQCSRD